MKLVVLITVATFLQATGSSFAQRISINVQNIPLSEVMERVQAQSGHPYFLKGKDIAHTKIDAQFEDIELAEAMNRILLNLPASWTLQGRTIVVKPEKVPLVKSIITRADEASYASVPQEIDISGKVTDEFGDPIERVTVSLKGTSIATDTDPLGNYQLRVPENGLTLVFSILGYERKEIRIGSSPTLNVTMKAVVNDLEEVVIIGYGTQRKQDLTGAVSSVSAEILQQRPSTNIEQTLSGAVAGVDVSLNSGKPGGTPQIRVRGSTSVSNTNDPLYVVDGVMLNVERIQGGAHAIGSIDPSNIESIDVLKDASSTAIYGARGANGVILITTKKGRRDGGQVGYNGYASVGTVAKRIDLMNAEEFLMVEDVAYQNAAKFDPEGFARGNYTDPQVKRRNYAIDNDAGNPVLFDKDLNPLYDTDWQDEAFQKAFIQNHNLSFAGGDKDTRYGMYLTYRDEDGVMKDSWLNRYSGRFVLETKLNNWLNAGGVLNYNDQKERLLENWALRSVYQNIPVIPVKFPDGSWAKGEVYPGVEGPNQRQVAEGDKRILRTRNIIGNVFTNITFMEGLSLKTMVGTNQITQNTNRYAGRDVDWVAQTQGGIASLASLTQQSWQFENLLNYETEIGGEHAVKALVGQSLQVSDRFTSHAETWGFLDDYYEYNNLSVGSNPRPSASSSSKYSMSSFFGRLNYVYSDKYLFTATGRVDGSSKFGANNRYAFFPSAALGWLISEEGFLRGNSTVNYLKLRTSYGLTGNSEIANYQYEAGLGTYTAIYNGNRNTGIGINLLANPNLKWESNTQADVGIEVGLFDNRISFEGDIYYRKSKDMLLARPVPRSSGYGSVIENIGNMENRGIELALTTHNIQNNNFKWSTSLNFSINRNKVLKLHGGSDILVGSVPGGMPGSIIREGLPINTFVGYFRDGTWGTAEAAAALTYNKKPGDVRYRDVNNDGKINSEDRVPIGNGVPDGYGSMINTIGYKNFELVVDIQFMYGNDVMWEANQVIEDRTGAYNNMLRTVLNAWTPDNQNTSIAQMKPLQVGYDTNNDSYRLKDGSFIRGRNVMLYYTVPSVLLSPMKISSLRLYAGAQNLFLISKYPGYDPEVSTISGDFTRGRASFYEYPTARVFRLGVNIEF